jgi:SOS response regulatory protein OraA/RecX
LTKKTSDQSLVTNIVEHLHSIGFLDDTKFATWLIESRSRTRPRGKRLLLHELKAKGILQKALPVDFDEKELAVQALQKKLSLWKSMPYRDFQAKAYRFLASRGFSWEVIEPTIKKLYNSTDVNPDS